jgi:hypothetical protein
MTDKELPKNIHKWAGDYWLKEAQQPTFLKSLKECFDWTRETSYKEGYEQAKKDLGS